MEPELQNSVFLKFPCPPGESPPPGVPVSTQLFLIEKALHVPTHLGVLWWPGREKRARVRSGGVS